MVIHDLGDDWIAPQPVDGQGKLLGKAEVGVDGGEVQLIACNLLCGCLRRWLFVSWDMQCEEGATYAVLNVRRLNG